MAIIWNARLGRFQNTVTGRIVSVDEAIKHIRYIGNRFRDEYGRIIPYDVLGRPYVSRYPALNGVWHTARVITTMVRPRPNQRLALRVTAFTPDGRLVRVVVSMPRGVPWDREDMLRKKIGKLKQALIDKGFTVSSGEVTQYILREDVILVTSHP